VGRHGDNEKMRRCEENSLYEGYLLLIFFSRTKLTTSSKLELVTWSTPGHPLEDFGKDVGWGAVIVEEADEHKKKSEASLLY
jgi:hypothetical protein